MSLSSSPPTGLGPLARLPPELRLMIYEHAVSNGSASALMRTSKTVNSEIEPCLYDTLDINLYPRRLDPWASISFRQLPGASWPIEDEEEFHDKRRGVLKLPYTKFNMTRVIIHAPEPNSLGQLSYLWLKVDSFVHVLIRHRTLKGMRIVIELRDYKGHTWTTKAQRRLENEKASYLRYAPLPNQKSKRTRPIMPNPYDAPPPSPRWCTDFFWIPFGRMYLKKKKDPIKTRNLSDGSVHDTEGLIKDIQMYLAVTMERQGWKGLETEALHYRVTCERIVDHILWNGPPPWESLKVAEEYYGDRVRRPAKYLPGIVRELLDVKKEKEEE
ncbi:hypothetical protein BDV06DRAFT_60981 [Aspergillus oleicola]